MPRKHPPRLLPSTELRDRWELDADSLGVAAKAYIAKWRKFWTTTLEELQDQETWEDRDIVRLAEYVEWMRKADFHGTKAAAAPYKVGDSGRVYAHPGFKLEQEARREARIVAAQLLLGLDVTEALRDQEHDDGPPANPD